MRLLLYAGVKVCITIKDIEHIISEIKSDHTPSYTECYYRLLSMLEDLVHDKQIEKPVKQNDFYK